MIKTQGRRSSVGHAALAVFLRLALIEPVPAPPVKAGQPAPKEYAATYDERFKGQPRNPQDFALIGGAEAPKLVTYEPEGLRITLPTGHGGARIAVGLASRFGATGDFEATMSYEILAEPQPEDAGTQTRVFLAVGLNKLNPVHNQTTLNRRITPEARSEYLTWMHLWTEEMGLQPEEADTFPAQGKNGRLRIVRKGTEVSFFAAEGANGKFHLLTQYQLGAEDVSEFRIGASTGGVKAALDVRITDLRIRAASLPKRSELPKVAKAPEPKIPTKDYAQKYFQSFKSDGVRPDGWNFTSQLAEQCVQFEPAGLRITLPAGGPEMGQSAGIRSAFGVKGDFEITLSFEILKDPDPADAGKVGTRLTLSANLDTPLLDTPKSEVATLNRSMATKGFSTWVRSRFDPKPLSHGFPTPALTGRLRLVRSGDELFYLASVGTDQPFAFLKKYRFGAEDLQRVGISASTGGEKASLDVRVTDLRIRADAIPGAPPSEAEAQQPGQPAQPVAAAPQERSRPWLVAILLVGGAIALLLSLGLGLTFFLRKRRAATTNAPKDAAPTAVSVACPKCARMLKTTAEMAGKKVKCAQCGTAVLVPSMR